MPSLLRSVRTAVRAIRRNALRSALTCLGITIGIGAVITMVEIGQGSSAAIQRTIAAIGANVVQLDPQASSIGGVSSGSGGKASLTPADCDAIIEECSAVRWAAPSVDVRMQAIYGNRNWSPSTILGTTPAYLAVRSWTELAEGKPFTDADVRSVAGVCMVGQTVVHQLFDGQSPVGKEIRVGPVMLKVIGVLAGKGANMSGRDQDDVLILPWTTVKFRLAGLRQINQAAAASTAGQVNSLNQMFPSQQASIYPARSQSDAANSPVLTRFSDLDDIWVSATSPEEVPEAMQQITQLLRQRHRLTDGQPDDFRLRDLAEISESVASTSKSMTELLLSVSLISLMVGGVGIMNIMLVSVTERTREIGLRMAVGARSRDILRQFLIEAVALCVVGGIAGIMLGRGLSITLTTVLQWPTKPSMLALVAAVSISFIVGVTFGYYPAWKASRLDPIEALRYE